MRRGDGEMTCRELVELITAWLDDALPPVDRALFDAHLVDCPYCRTYLTQMRETVHALGRLTEETIDPAARDELLMRFHDWHRA
jgi:anti-sigma factor RsiW